MRFIIIIIITFLGGDLRFALDRQPVLITNILYSISKSESILRVDLTSLSLKCYWIIYYLKISLIEICTQLTAHKPLNTNVETSNVFENKKILIECHTQTEPMENYLNG